MKYHYYRTATNNRWRFFFVHFQGHMEGFAPILTQQGSIEVTERAEFEKTFDRLISVVRDAAPTASITCNLLLTQLLTSLSITCYHVQRDEKLERHLPALNRCITYLRENYAQPITLGDMAAHMHMSQYHFIRVFESYMHTTPYAYLLSLRINMSHELLIMTDESVQEIARRVGMKDCNAFIRAFKKRFGQTPDAYRRSFRGGNTTENE
jgi:transcriptional regulator GlxA family with amidase domain